MSSRAPTTTIARQRGCTDEALRLRLALRAPLGLRLCPLRRSRVPDAQLRTAEAARASDVQPASVQAGARTSAAKAGCERDEAAEGRVSRHREPADRTGYLVAALWLIAMAWLFATAAWELPDKLNENELPLAPVYGAAAQGGGR